MLRGYRFCCTQCWYFCWNLKYVPELGLPPQIVNRPAVPEFVECDTRILNYALQNAAGGFGCEQICHTESW